MILPVQITFRNVEPFPEVEDWVREEAAKLDTFYGRITSCRVAVEAPHRRRRAGNPYHVRIELGVPGEELVVKNETSPHPTLREVREIKRLKRLELEAPYKDLHLAISSAFKAARRRLEDYARRLRGDVKNRVAPPRGRIARLFPEQGYGFLESADSREIYFHKDSLIGKRFEQLEVGDVVLFAEEMGEKGPQASTVRLVRRRSKEGTGWKRETFPKRAAL